MAERLPKHPKDANNVQVFIRMRPFGPGESQNAQCAFPIDLHEITMREKESGVEPPVFHFDRIFDCTSTQQEVFEVVASGIISKAFEGINGTIFCYGQTSSGKTYTCLGDDFLSESTRGILPRTIEEIQAHIQSRPKNIECKMKISMIQIYNEKIKDLLDQTKLDLKIRSNKSQGIFMPNVTEKYILSEEQSYIYISKGIENRSVSFTQMNSLSSRSHMVVTLTLHQHDFYTGEARAAKITFIDLAGSEKISRTGAEGKVLEEAKKINTSLSALGKVINALSEGKNSHVPYRDSKLTRLLQESLGGNSITSLVINVSPAIANQHETLSSLRFGFRAKAIKNEPKVNKQYTVPELLELLNKADKKIKKRTEVIKELMVEKGCTSLSVNQFINLYIIRTEGITEGHESDEEASSPLKSISSSCRMQNNKLVHCGSDPMLFRLGSPINAYEKKIEDRQHEKCAPQLSLLHLNKSSGYPIKKFLTPKREDFARGKSFSKQPFFRSKDKNTVENVQSDEEMLLDNLVDKLELRFSTQSQEGHSESGKSFSIHSKVYELQVGPKKVSQQQKEQNDTAVSREAECKSESSFVGKEHNKLLDEVGKSRKTLEENLLQIRKNLQTIRFMKQQQLKRAM